ncbi:MAG: LysR family transcriptional regulator [Sphingomonadaceae bacterium]
MNWSDLRYFVALARHGTLSGAAREVRAEHTTVARRIASLEQSLGTRLFEREAKGFVLTVEGERIVDHARRIEAEIFGIQRQLDDGGTALEGTVRISAPPVFAATFLAQRLAKLRIANPKLVIELAGESLPVNLFRRDSDIAIRLNRPDSASIVARKVGRLAYGLYGAHDYIDRVPEEAWEFLTYDESLDDVVQQKWLFDLIGTRDIAFRSNDLSSLHAVATQGTGLAALPRYLGDGDARLRRIDCDATTAARDLWLLVHPDLRRSPRIRIVLDHLADLLKLSRPLLDPVG